MQARGRCSPTVQVQCKHTYKRMRGVHTAAHASMPHTRPHIRTPPPHTSLLLALSRPPAPCAARTARTARTAGAGPITGCVLNADLEPGSTGVFACAANTTGRFLTLGMSGIFGLLRACEVDVYVFAGGAEAGASSATPRLASANKRVVVSSAATVETSIPDHQAYTTRALAGMLVDGTTPSALRGEQVGLLPAAAAQGAGQSQPCLSL